MKSSISRQLLDQMLRLGREIKVSVIFVRSFSQSEMIAWVGQRLCARQVDLSVWEEPGVVRQLLVGFSRCSYRVGPPNL